MLIMMILDPLVNHFNYTLTKIPWSPSTLSTTHLANPQIAIRREPCNHVAGLDWKCIGFSLFIGV